MVKMRARPAPPEGLLRRQAEWTERWRTKMTSGSTDWATQRAKEVIKEGLHSFANFKCAYCEARLDWPAGVHIEHFVAKNPSYELAFEWTNLFPSCSGCNATKGNQDHGGAMIKPDEEDPEEFLAYDVVTGEIEAIDRVPNGHSVRVTETVQLCGLGRGDLVQRRRDTYLLYKGLLEAILRFRQRGELDEAMKIESLLLDPVREFKLVLRTLLIFEGFADLATEDRRRFGSHP